MLFSGLLALSKLIGQKTSFKQLKVKLARWVQPA
ncbi:hypothetical protein LMED105_05862 [Limnobacter sp. MED105]|nr:hypothetical protein LMED105_05862 [Limnobacter sp. MED105]